VALLTTQTPLRVATNVSFPPVEIDATLTAIDAWGFGAGSVSGSDAAVPVGNGAALLHTSFVIDHALDAEFEALAGASAVCDGDSGGPATVVVNGVTLLAGILRSSEASGESNRCTKANGRQRWTRLGAYSDFFEHVLGPCDHSSVGGVSAMSCSGVPSRPRSRNVADAEFNYFSRAMGVNRGTQGAALVPAAGSPTRLETVSFSTRGGATHEFQIDATTVVDRYGTMYLDTNDQGDAPPGDAVVWAARGWSQNNDRRFAISGSTAPEVGRLRSTSNAFSDGQKRVAECTGTLIDRRIVRTAAHCLVVPDTTLASQPAVQMETVRFELERNGSSVTKVVTASSWFTGHFSGQDCHKAATYKSKFNECTWADWGFVILPANAWDSLGYTPYYMGYRYLGSGDLNLKGSNAGYPSCKSNISNRVSGCTIGENLFKYANNDAFERKVFAFTNGTAKYRVGCDTSPGMSGSPFYDGVARQLLGHVQFEECSTCLNRTGLDFYAPNHVLGHDSYLYSLQNDLRSNYP
jgi:V8-like Glu-specific endopeptidase